MSQDGTTAFTDAAAMWNRRFEGDDFLFGAEPNEWLREHVAVWPPGGRILCVADGEGRNSVWLARQGFVVTPLTSPRSVWPKARRFAAARRERELQRRRLRELRLARASLDGVWPPFSSSSRPGTARTASSRT